MTGDKQEPFWCRLSCVSPAKCRRGRTETAGSWERREAGSQTRSCTECRTHRSTLYDLSHRTVHTQRYTTHDADMSRLSRKLTDDQLYVPQWKMTKMKEDRLKHWSSGPAMKFGAKILRVSSSSQQKTPWYFGYSMQNEVIIGRMNFTEGYELMSQAAAGCYLTIMLLSCPKTKLSWFRYRQPIACKRLVNVYKLCVHVYKIKYKDVLEDSM